MFQFFPVFFFLFQKIQNFKFSGHFFEKKRQHIFKNLSFKFYSNCQNVLSNNQNLDKRVVIVTQPQQSYPSPPPPPALLDPPKGRETKF